MKRSKDRETIDRLVKATGCQNKSDLARYLEITPQRITEAMGRGKISEAWFYKIAYRTGRRVEWLRTGQGPEFLDEAAAEEVEFGRSALVRELTEAMDHLDEEEQAAIRRAVEILKTGPLDVRQHLMGQLKLLARMAPKPPGKKARAYSRGGGGRVG